jgi:hypothetical protein
MLVPIHSDLDFKSIFMRTLVVVILRPQFKMSISSLENVHSGGGVHSFQLVHQNG